MTANPNQTFITDFSPGSEPTPSDLDEIRLHLRDLWINLDNKIYAYENKTDKKETNHDIESLKIVQNHIAEILKIDKTNPLSIIVFFIVWDENVKKLVIGLKNAQIYEIRFKPNNAPCNINKEKLWSEAGKKINEIMKANNGKEEIKDYRQINRAFKIANECTELGFALLNDIYVDIIKSLDGYPNGHPFNPKIATHKDPQRYLLRLQNNGFITQINSFPYFLDDPHINYNQDQDQLNYDQDQDQINYDQDQDQLNYNQDQDQINYNQDQDQLNYNQDQDQLNYDQYRVEENSLFELEPLDFQSEFYL